MQATPAGYQIPAAQTIRVKSVRAVVDGSAAAAAFLPTLQLVAPSGQVVWESATDTTVAAAGSADVSWFPRLKRSAASIFPNSSYGNTVIGGAPFAYYPLDETVGTTIHDQSGNARDLTNANAASIYNVHGLVATTTDGALYVPLGADVSKCPKGAYAWTPSTFSVEAWFQVFSSDLINEVVTYALSTQKHEQKFQLRLNAGKAQFECYDAADNVYDATGLADLRDGKAHYIVGTYNGALLAVYVDGALAGSLVTGFTPTFVNGTIGVGGAGPLLSASNIDGVIDEVALYSYALTAAQVLDHYTKATSV